MTPQVTQPGAAQHAAARRGRHCGPQVATFRDDRGHVMRGAGTWAWAWDDAGRKHLDCYNTVPHLGYFHTGVHKATGKRAATLRLRDRAVFGGPLNDAEPRPAPCAPPHEAVGTRGTDTHADAIAPQMARIQLDRKADPNG